MDDLKKTKAQLIEELRELRRRLGTPPHKDEAQNSLAKTRTPRNKLETEIEFIGDFDVVKAYGIDISEGGICFEVKEHLPFEMRFTHGEKTVECRAYLMWMRRVDEQSCRMGFRFSQSKNN